MGPNGISYKSAAPGGIGNVTVTDLLPNARKVDEFCQIYEQYCITKVGIKICNILPTSPQPQAQQPQGGSLGFMPIWTAVDTDGNVLESSGGLGTTGVIHMTPAFHMHERHLDVFKTTISKQSRPILATNGSYQAREKYDKPLVIAWH